MFNLNIYAKVNTFDMGASWTRTELRIVNNTNTDIVSTSIAEVDSYDWNGDFRPDKNFVGVSIPSKGFVQQAEDVYNKANCSPFKMTLYFKNGLQDAFRIHQKHAIDCCPGFIRFEESHDITYHADRSQKLLIITVNNTQEQITEAKMQDLLNEAEHAMSRLDFNNAVNKYDAAYRLASTDSEKNSIKTKRFEAIRRQAETILNEAWEAEQDESRDRSREAQQKFAEAEERFEKIGDHQKVELIKSKILGNELFNAAGELEEQADGLLRNAKDANDYDLAKQKYGEALGKYEEAKLKFAQKSLGNGLFTSSIEVVETSIAGVTQAMKHVDEAKLSYNVSRVHFNDNKQSTQTQGTMEINVAIGSSPEVN